MICVSDIQAMHIEHDSASIDYYRCNMGVVNPLKKKHAQSRLLLLCIQQWDDFITDVNRPRCSETITACYSRLWLELVNGLIQTIALPTFSIFFVCIYIYIEYDILIYGKNWPTFFVALYPVNIQWIPGWWFSLGSRGSRSSVPFARWRRPNGLESARCPVVPRLGRSSGC